MRLIPLAATLALLLILAPPAGASVVTYLDGGEVWRAALDGSRKLKLSGPPIADHEWRESAQADNGRVIAVGRPDGKISTINTFTLWGPDGAIVHQGILQDNGSWSQPVFPVSLDLNAGGTTAVYGYSNSTGFPQIYERGTYAMPVDKAWGLDAFKIVDETWPTIVGNRVVSAAGTTGPVNVQAPAGQPPYSTDFVGWLDTSGVAGAELNRTDVAANGTIAAIELVAWDGGTQTDGVIAMVPAPGLGQTPTAGDCFLPTQGVAGEVSVSQDAKSVAWHDDRGVVVAGTPNFAATGAGSACVLTRAPVVISATGTEPSLGGTSLPVEQPPPPPEGPAPDPSDPGSAAKPGLSLGAKVKASGLKKGLKLKVTVAAAGTVKATGKVGGKLVARGSRKTSSAGTVTVRLKATRKAAKKLGKLRGKRLKIKVTAGGESATITRKLR